MTFRSERSGLVRVGPGMSPIPDRAIFHLAGRLRSGWSVLNPLARACACASARLRAPACLPAPTHTRVFARIPDLCAA